MGRPWHIDNPERWEVEKAIGRRRLADFEDGIEGSKVYLRGTVSVLVQDGLSYGPFRIKIVYPGNFPKRGSVPSVFLESHRDRWRNVPDSHIEVDWKLCLFIAATSSIDFADENALNRLVDVLSLFLVKETFFQQDLLIQDATGIQARWIGPWYSHGEDGLKEALLERGKPLNRNDPCLCGSGRKAKYCHYDMIRKVRA